VVVERLGEENSAFGAPIFVAGPDVGDAQVEEAGHFVEIGRSLEDDLGLIRCGAAAGIEDDLGIGQLDVTRIFGLDHFSAQNPNVEVFRFFLIPHGEELGDPEAFAGNRRVGKIHWAASSAGLDHPAWYRNFPGDCYFPVFESAIYLVTRAMSMTFSSARLERGVRSGKMVTT